MPSQACCACAICSSAVRDSNVDDRPCITAVPFSFGGFSLTQTYLSMDFSVLDYVFGINCNLCLWYFVRKDKGSQDAFMSNLLFFFAKGECKKDVNGQNQLLIHIWQARKRPKSLFSVDTRTNINMLILQCLKCFPFSETEVWKRVKHKLCGIEFFLWRLYYYIRIAEEQMWLQREESFCHFGKLL